MQQRSARRIQVQRGDVLVVNGYELSADLLREMVASTRKRVLWAFMRKGKDIQAALFTEEHCVWLTDKDLERTAADETQQV